MVTTTAAPRALCAHCGLSFSADRHSSSVAGYGHGYKAGWKEETLLDVVLLLPCDRLLVTMENDNGETVVTVDDKWQWWTVVPTDDGRFYCLYFNEDGKEDLRMHEMNAVGVVEAITRRLS